MGMIQESEGQRGRPIDTVRAWGEAIGPFYGMGRTRSGLNVSPSRLLEMMREGEILTIRTKDNKLLFPTRQFEKREGSLVVKPAVSAALQYLRANEVLFNDIKDVHTEDGVRIVDEWTIAATLLQRDERGRTLLDDLGDHLDNPQDSSWTRLRTLNGAATAVRIVLSENPE